MVDLNSYESRDSSLYFVKYYEKFVSTLVVLPKFSFRDGGNIREE